MAQVDAETALIAAAKTGDRAALQHLLLNHCHAVSRQIAARLPAKVQLVISVEDVLQQTLTQAVRDFDKLTADSAESLHRWLGVIAEHRVYDAIKNHGRHKRSGGQRRTVAPVAKFVELLADQRDSPSKQVAAAEAVQAVQVGMATLPHDQHEAVSLRYFRGLSVEEAAAEMGRTPGAVRGLVDRAKRNLRCALGNSSRWFGRK